MKSIYLIPLILLPIVLHAQHENITILNNYNPEETSIIINPNNPLEMVAGANLRNCCWSGDGGHTWDSQILSSQFNTWGDPCVIVDTAGHFYFFHLTNPSQGDFIDRLVCQKSEDGGQSWTELSQIGWNNGKGQDKEWAVVNRHNNHIYMTWTQFDSYGSSSSSDSSIIFFSRSFDAGQTWSVPKRISAQAGDCIDSDNTVEGAVPAVGPNGEIYVSWAGPDGLVFNKSTDEGETWLEHELIIADIPGGWDYSVPGLIRCNGLPVTLCDTSGGPNHGSIYINWSDQRNGSDDTDVWLIKSTDGGVTWSTPKRVNNDPPGSQQFLCWMAIDQSNGKLYFVFYDRRDHDDLLTDVYMAYSDDGGQSFHNFKVSDDPFIPDDGVFMGDYNNVCATNETIRPIWTEYSAEDGLSIHTSIINTALLSAPEAEQITLQLDQNFPNPAKKSTRIRFKLKQNGLVSLRIFDMTGVLRATIINNSFLQSGIYLEEVNFENLKLNPGLYYYELVSKDKRRIKKMNIIY